MPRTDRTPSRWREALPTLGLGATVVAAVAGAVATEFVPDDAPALLVVLATVGGLAVGLVAEHALGLALERRGRERAAAQAVEHLRARAPAGLAALLSARLDNQILPFVGREDHLAKLLAWCTSRDQDGEPFRLITGAGGVGKTRLADELQRRLRRSDDRWECLFLAADQGHLAGEVADLRTYARNRPVLVVIDYAENRPDLRTFLNEVLDDAGTIRVLMLARTAGNWWDTLTAIPGSLGAALTAGYDGADLGELDVDAQDILDTAAGAYARALGVAVPTVRLDVPGRRLRVLDLATAALVAVLTSMERAAEPSIKATAGVERVTASQMFDELLRHEASSYWAATAQEARIADQLTFAMRQALVAAVALLGASDEDDTLALTRRVLGTFTEDVQPDPVATARWLRKTYTPTEASGRWVEPLTPDRVAERLIVRVLIESRNADRRARALLEELNHAQAVHAMTVLSRAATDPARDDTEQDRVRALADHLATHLPASPTTHGAVLAAVPSPTVRMAPTAALLARQHVNLLERSGGNGEELAASLLGLATHLAQARRLTEALAISHRAVAAYERLAARPDGDKFAAGQGKALSDLARTLREVGRPDEAFPVALRAVQIHERLDAEARGRFEPQLADSLSSLSYSMSLRHPEAALSPCERAARIYRSLARTSPDRYEISLARTLQSLGYLYSRLRRPDDSLLAARESVDLYIRLASSNRDRADPGLGMSSSNFCLQLAEAGHPDEGLLHGHRALRIFEDLARSSPDRFRHEVARAAHNLGVCYWQLRQPRQGLPLMQRAVGIREELVRSMPARSVRPAPNQGDPSQIELHLAMSLSNLGFWLADIGRPNEALAYGQRAVQIYERLAQSDPDRPEPDLSGPLWDLGMVFRRHGQPEDGLLLTHWAVQVHERLAQVEPARFDPWLAHAWSVLADQLSRAGRPGDALAALTRATGLLQDCHDRGVPHLRDRLTAHLDRLASAHHDLGDTDAHHEYESRAAALRQQP